MKRGNRLGNAAIEFEAADGILAGFQLVGFTICDDAEKGLFVLFPASTTIRDDNKKTFFFLRPSDETQLEKLESLILDQYESMIAANNPKEVLK